MTANVDSMFYVGEVPWHGLGQAFDTPPETMSEAIIAAGLDREIGLKNLQTVDGESVPNKLTYYKDDGTHLGVVGPRYVPLQNVELFNWFEPFVETKEVELHTAGSLCDGTKVWVLGQLNESRYGMSEIVGKDYFRKFILLSNSHDGTTAIRVGFTPIRVVCANTMAFAHNSEASKLIRVRHTANAVLRLEEVRDIMNLANQEFEATADQYRYLATKSFCKTDLRKYIKIVLGCEATPDDEIKTRTNNIIDNIDHLVHNGFGQDKAPGTWYAAYNGVAEYLSYARGRNNNNRMNSLWFGTNANVNQQALTAAITMAA